MDTQDNKIRIDTSSQPSPLSHSPPSPASPIYIPDSSPPPRRALLKKRAKQHVSSSSSYHASSTSRSRSSNSRERYIAYQTQRFNNNAAKRARRLLFSDNGTSSDENNQPAASSEPPIMDPPGVTQFSPEAPAASSTTAPIDISASTEETVAATNYFKSSDSNTYSAIPTTTPPLPFMPSPSISYLQTPSSSDIDLNNLIPTMSLSSFDPVIPAEEVYTVYQSTDITQPYYTAPGATNDEFYSYSTQFETSNYYPCSSTLPSNIQYHPYPPTLPAIPDKGEQTSLPETNTNELSKTFYPDKTEEKFIREILSPPLTQEEMQSQVSPAYTEDSFYYPSELYEQYKTDKIREHHNDKKKTITKTKFEYSYVYNRFFENYPIQNDINMSCCKEKTLKFFSDTKKFDSFLKRLIQKVPLQKQSKLQSIFQNNIKPENIFLETKAFKFSCLTEDTKPILIIPKLNTCDSVTKFTECVLDDKSDTNVTFLLAYINEHCDSGLLIPTFEKRQGTTTNHYYGNHRQTCHNAKAGKEKLDTFIKNNPFIGDFIRNEDEKGIISYDSAPMTNEIEEKLDFYSKNYFSEFKLNPCTYYGKCIENTRIKYIPSEWKKGDYCFIVPNSRLFNTLKQKSTFPIHSLLTPFKYEFVNNIYNSMIDRKLHRLVDGLYSVYDINAYLISEHFFILYKDPAFEKKILLKLPRNYFDEPFYKLKAKKL